MLGIVKCNKWNYYWFVEVYGRNNFEGGCEFLK